MDNLLSAGIPSLRLSILARFCKFYASVSNSNSMEVRLVASLASVDIRSPTGSNLFGIRKEFQLEPLDTNLGLLRSTILESTSVVPKPTLLENQIHEELSWAELQVRGYTSGYFRYD